MSLIHNELREGFAIAFYAEAEDMTIDQMKFEADAIEEISEQLDSGALVLFCAKVTASKNGVELASEFLGGCIYKDEKDFVNNDCYYGDMVNAVIAEAKQTIIDLSKE